MLLLDEIAGQSAKHVGEAQTSKLTISVRELLRMRVELEWRAAQERTMNTGAYRDLQMFSEPHDQDAKRLERMFENAEKAFQAQRLFVLLDDKQARDLDEQVDVERTGAATFLLLTPLQGG